MTFANAVSSQNQHNSETNVCLREKIREACMQCGRDVTLRFRIRFAEKWRKSKFRFILNFSQQSKIYISQRTGVKSACLESSWAESAVKNVRVWWLRGFRTLQDKGFVKKKNSSPEFSLWALSRGWFPATQEYVWWENWSSMPFQSEQDLGLLVLGYSCNDDPQKVRATSGGRTAKLFSLCSIPPCRSHDACPNCMQKERSSFCTSHFTGLAWQSFCRCHHCGKILVTCIYIDMFEDCHWMI